MKVTGKTTHSTIIRGEVSEAELRAYVAGVIHVPADARVRFFVGDPPHDIDVNLGDPLRFEFVITGDVPVAMAPGERGVARCSAEGCPLPSLAGGLCASHLNRAALTTPTG